MALSLVNKSGVFAGVLQGGISWGAIWGGIAGCVIGTGISLSLDLFNSEANNIICLIILVSCVMGSFFGHIMAHLVDNKDDPLGRLIGSANHRISGNILKVMDLDEHQLLNAEIQAKRMSGREAMEIIHSVRRMGLPANANAESRVI